MGVSSKLVWAVMLAIGGTCYVVYRKIVSAVDRVSVDGLIRTLKKDPSKARAIAVRLDIPYGRHDNTSKAILIN